MRLINAKTLQIEEFSVENQIPAYIALSHTWTEDEVTLKDMTSDERLAKPAWHKITGICRKAIDLNIRYAWIDTCCIDKSSSAELSEAINSMFKWYANASRCITYLADVPACDHADHALQTFVTKLKETRWISRGWTLQELIAPKAVDFYDSSWQYRTCKDDITKVISDATGVPEDVLLNADLLSSYPVCTRLSWASRRYTTREEDEAYCLLGILGVNMPLIYGEGRRAFRRLQNAVVADRHDLTIFCHSTSQPSTHELFAYSPMCFRFSANIRPFPDAYVGYAGANKGVKISAGLPIRFGRVQCPAGEYETYCLMLGFQQDTGKQVGICMSMTAPGQFCRDASGQLVGIHAEFMSTIHYAPMTFYITSTVDPGVRGLTDAHLDRAIDLSANPPIELDRVVPIPEINFDMKRRVFFRLPRSFKRHLMVFAAQCRVVTGNCTTLLTVLIDYGEGRCRAVEASKQPRARIFKTSLHQDIADFVFLGNRAWYLSWPELNSRFPIVRGFDNTFAFHNANGAHKVRLVFKDVRLDERIVSRLFAEDVTSIKASL